MTEPACSNYWSSCTLLRKLILQFSYSVMSDSLRPHGLQHTRLPSPSSAPEIIQTHGHWVSDVIQPSHHPLSSPSPRAFNLSQHQGLFKWVSQFFTSGGQSIGASSAASVLPKNIQDWFPLQLTGLISLQSKGLLRIFSNTTVQKHQFFSAQLYSSTCTSIHDYWKTIALTRQTFLGKVMSLLFNMLSRLVTAFLPRSKSLVISWLQTPSAVILEPPKIKSLIVSIV